MPLTEGTIPVAGAQVGGKDSLTDSRATDDGTHFKIDVTGAGKSAYIGDANYSANHTYVQVSDADTFANSGINLASAGEIWAGDVNGDGFGTLVIIDDPAQTVTINKQVLMTGLPTSNPNVVGALWNDSGTLKISAG